MHGIVKEGLEWGKNLRTNSNPTNMVASPLDRAKAVADNGNWSIAIDCLQQLSIDQITHSELVLDIALQVLIQGDFDQQWEIAKIIPKLGDIAVQPLLDLLNDPDIDIEDRWVVARILGEFDRPQVITALIELIQQQEDLELTEIAISALTKIGIPAISALTELFATPNRNAAITILAQIRHSRTIEPLIQVINDPDPQLRSLIVEALGSFHDPRIPPLLITKLTDVAATVRKAAITALCLRSDLAAELDLSRHLRPLLFDLNLAVCQATALGLARLPDELNIEVLGSLLLSSQTPIELQSSVILALGWIGTMPAIDNLMAAFSRVAPSVAPEIAIAIGKTDREQIYASQVLADRLQTLDPSATIIRQEIATALGNLGNSAIVPDLILLLNDPDDRVKLYVKNAISKLSNKRV
jgi:HEAT repeat protein